jgi:TetR/AcrR family transcriptional regulator, tetracycline repressor protein
MPRPKTPLLDRQKIVDTALALIDESGVEKFSIHALARVLNVKSPSIYYYFTDRDELLTAVALAVLAKVRVPRRRSGDWSALLIESAVAYYRALRAHPNVAPLLLERRTRQSAAEGFETALEAMQAEGITPADGLGFIDCIEGIALTWVAFGATATCDTTFGELDTTKYPILNTARQRQKYDETTYRRMVTALGDGLRRSQNPSRAADGVAGEVIAPPSPPRQLRSARAGRMQA